TVTPVNDAPLAVADAFTTAEDTPATLTVLGNDRDVDGDPLAITAIGGQAVSPGSTVAVANGTVTLNPDGTLTFAPASNANGAVSFTYTVSDGQGGSATATVTGTVTPVNDAPVPAADGFTTVEDTPATLTVLGNDRDVDGNPLAITAIGGQAVSPGSTVAVANGTVTLNPDGTLTFAPVTDINGPVSFAYTVSDGQGGSATATVSGIVTPVQDAPVAIADAFATAEDTPATVTVLANDRDADGDPLTITAIDGQALAPGGTVAVASGAVTLNPDSTLTFAPTPNANGTVSFTYTVSDGRGGTATAVVAGTIDPVNDAPAPTADGFATAEDTSIPVPVLANDADVDGNLLTVTAIDGQAIAVGGSVAVAGGAVTLNADGTLTFAPAADFSGPVSFAYTVSDSQGSTATAAVTGTVTPVNDAPVAIADAFTTAEDTPAALAVLANDRDADGDPLAVTAIDGQTIAPGGTVAVANGAVTLNAAGTLTFAPAVDFNGPVSFTYTVSDGQGGSSTAVVTGTITPVNDAPVLGDDGFTVPEDGAVTFDLRANDSDVDGDPLTVTAIDGQAIAAGTSVAVPSGTVTLNPDGTLTFVPAADATGPVGFSATVSDGRGGSATSTVTGTITPVND
ncbi:Ig-like domain-containing protein, partial [Methylobacterium crusticola]|uniref:Ig-like domain-containing protein n=1 Tax=Methylobacterium crusticola TaxID=1697972 RepID=UPI001EE2D589